MHYMTAFVPELCCRGVTKVSFKAVSSFCIAAFASSLAVLMEQACVTATLLWRRIR